MVAVVLNLWLGMGAAALLTGVALTAFGLVWRPADGFGLRFAAAQATFLDAARASGCVECGRRGRSG